MEIENKLILKFLAEDLVNELCGVSLRRHFITAFSKILVWFLAEQNLEAEANFLKVSEDENEALAKSRLKDSMIEL